MKLSFYTFLFFILLCSKIFSATNSFNNLSNEKITDGFGNEIAYRIYVVDNKVENGKKGIGKVYSIPKLPKSEYMPGRIHIKTKNYFSLNNRFNAISKILKKSLGQENIVRVDAPYDRFANGPLKQFDKDGISRIYELTYSAEIDPYDLCKELMKDPDVEYAVPIFMRYFNDFTPNDPEISKQWALTKMQSFKSWDISKGDSSIIIAITDSGIEYTHEDLAPNMWVNKKEIPNDGIDNDGNGYIDDYLGWDFVGAITSSQAVQGQWKPDNDPKPGHYHGTHVAGCAAAAGNNGKGVAGPGFKCKIMALKCGTDATNSTGIFRGYDAILYAAQMGAQIINCSWGGPGSSPAEQELINTAYNMGSVIVVSAGNSFKNIDYGNSYPAGYENVLCVGATRSDDSKAWFTNYGYLVDVYGPGDNIYATMPGGNKYGYLSGTSMSSPVVAGVCGQLKALHPDWSQKQIMHQIRSTSENVITKDATLRPMYYGRVNAYNAMSYNNTKLPTYEKIPGISVSQILSQGVEVLTDYNPASFTIEITNYLSIARRTKVKISALQKYLSVSVSQIDVGTIEQMGRDTFSLVVRLLESAPWYEGKVDILLVYESDSYVDYEIIQLPIKLETKNKFSLNYVFPETDLPLWYSALSLSKDNIMLAGARQSTGYGIFYKNSFGYNTNQITPRPLYCLYSYDENTFYAGTGGNPTNIIKSENAGQSWISQDVSSITNFINDIYFFDNLEGIFAGDPSGGSWGVGITTNGGQSWAKSNKLPSVLSGESGYAGCAFGLGNNFWFGTNKGRVIFTRDRGKNWQSVTVKSNGYIHKILFLDGNIGVAVYGNSQNDAERKLAVTWDGGINWTTDRFNFGKTLGVSPIYLYKPKDATLIIALCSGGEIYSSKDYGQSWQPVLSQKYSTVSFGAAYGEFGECRIWSGETELTYLDFEYMPDNAKKTLQINPSGTIAFGDVEANKSKTITVTLTNTGNMNINIDSTKIILGNGVYEEEFRITFPVNGKMAVNESKTLRVKFNPLKEGLRQAELVIYSNADIKIQKVNLTGTGTNAVKKISFVGDTLVKFDTVEV
ncbi:choice-of-anchor D domain-containing protein, partial [Bacteroidetes/Chlorobi group bacterium ChocPot_Mid]